MRALGLALLTLAAMSSHARPDTLPKGLGHPPGADHWYDMSCCDRRDCEPVERGAITVTPTGFRAKYITSNGVIAEGDLPFGVPGIRASKDGYEHACAIGKRVVCIYIPAGT